MNYDQFTGVIRAIAPALVGWLAANLSSTTQGLIVTALVAVSAAIWSVLNNKSGKVIS